MNKVTDNVELDFPARMSDGRQFTDYSQNCLLNNNLSQGRGSWEYRHYLTQNAVQIQQQMIQKVESATACTKCSDNTVLAVKNIQHCTPTGCTYQLNDENGVGLGRKY